MNRSELSFQCQNCSKLLTVDRNKAAEFLRKNPIVLCSCCKKLTSSPTAVSSYSSWYGLKRRCDCPNQTGYERYGGRGISYDPNWSTFEGFYMDMGDKPGPNYELDRINNNGNYCKDNCHWVTHAENCRNRGGRRPTRMYTYNGKTLCIADWAKEIGITPQSLQKRLNKGWPLELALSPEKRDKDPSKRVITGPNPNKGKTIRNANSKYITIDGETKTYTEWEKEKGLSDGLISKRLQQGCSEYEAVMRPINSRQANSKKTVS